VLVGLGSSAFWTFAVEHLARGGLTTGASRAFLGVVGVAGILATFTADFAGRVGARPAYRVIATAEAAAMAVVALAPASLTAAFAGGAIFGVAYTALVALQVLAATRTYASAPSSGVAAMLFASGAGLLAGPLLAGLFAGEAGLASVLLAGAAVVVLSIPLAPADAGSQARATASPGPPVHPPAVRAGGDHGRAWPSPASSR
jgi:predicted MFS family arabinose efflux permease